MRREITRSSADTGGELFEATNWLDRRCRLARNGVAAD